MNNNRAKFLFSGYRWIIIGILIGLIFYLFFGNIIPYLFEEEPLERSLLYGVTFWSLFGIGFVGFTKLTIDLGYTGKKWIIQGLVWGFSMFATMVLAVPYFGAGEISLKSILFGLPFWSLAGVGYGYVMKLYYNKHGLPKESTEVNH